MSTTDTTTLKWEDPPASTSRVRKWDSTAAELRGNPGKWAKIGSSMSSTTAGNIRAGRNVSFPHGEFEVAYRAEKGATVGDIYVRFVGAGA